MKDKKKKKEKFKILKTLTIVFIVLVVIGLAINSHVKKRYSDNILSEDACSSLNDVDCILILGCGVYGDEPSPMLSDRLSVGTELYKKGFAPKILMSGDHGSDDYDELTVMVNYALNEGVPKNDIFADHAGFSTYESMYRAKEIFDADKIIIITQGYHLKRAVFDANKLGIEAYGVPSDLRLYAGDLARNVREIMARIKDYFYCLFKPEPTYLGDVIPINGNGNADMN